MIGDWPDREDPHFPINSIFTFLRFRAPLSMKTVGKYLLKTES